MSLAPLARAFAGLATSLTLYAAPCLSAGSLVAIFHRPLGLDLPTAFTLGFFAAVGPVYLTYASGWGMRRTLAQFREWKEAELIQAKEFEELRRHALAWFRARRFGK
jgi:hypothetical protein